MSATPQHVAVLMGGWSAEREVSLVSGAAVVEALRRRAIRVTPIDVGHNVANILAGLKPDVAFNALHGRFGEDGCVQGVLEVLGIPYTHSGVLASSIAMDKPTAKILFERAGIRCTQGAVFHRDQVLAGHVMPMPYVVKPINEGSSVGVKVVFDGTNRAPFDSEAWHYGDHVLVERYVPGRELTAAIMGERTLGVTEIRSHHRFFDYEAKYTKGEAEHFCPAPIPPDKYRQAMDMALKAHQALGCRGVSRSDMRYDDTPDGTGEIYLMEINTQPGFTPVSLVPELAAHAGIDFESLCLWLLEDASCRR